MPGQDPVEGPVVGRDGPGDGGWGVLPCLGLLPRRMPYANHPHSAFLERGWFAYSGSGPRQGKTKGLVRGEVGERRKQENCEVGRQVDGLRTRSEAAKKREAECQSGFECRVGVR